MLVIYGDYEGNLPFTGILREVYGPLYATSTQKVNQVIISKQRLPVRPLWRGEPDLEVAAAGVDVAGLDQVGRHAALLRRLGGRAGGHAVPVGVGDACILGIGFAWIAFND